MPKFRITKTGERIERPKRASKSEIWQGLSADTQNFIKTAIKNGLSFSVIHNVSKNEYFEIEANYKEGKIK